MSSEIENTDALLRRLGGCGVFQLVLCICASLAYVQCGFTMMFMTFGIYNPGWRCLDNVTTMSPSNDSNINNNEGISTISSLVSASSDTTGKNIVSWDDSNDDAHHNIPTPFNSSLVHYTVSCTGFSECMNVEFNPEASTIVTEWALVCEDSWKSSTTIAIQMAGMTVGHFVAGYLGDAHGRKCTLCANVFICAVLTFVCVASLSWEMFTVIRFFLGVNCGIIFCVANVYMTEYATSKWRAVIPSIPMWCLGCVILSLCSYALKDWRDIHVFIGVFVFLLLIPLSVLPESLRWLVVNQKDKKSIKAVTQIKKLNRVKVSGEDCLARLANQQERCEHEKTTIYSFVHLFKKGYLRNTLILGLTLFVSNLVYFSSSFGVASLPGNLYVINIIIYSTELPANIIGWFAPNIFGRKPTGSAINIAQGVSVFLFLAFANLTTGSVREIGVIVFIIISRICADAGWFVVLTSTSEIFPTVIRAAAIGWMMFVAGIAAIFSPYLVITDDVTRVSYIVMGVLSVVCGVLYLFIPETKGIDLTDEDKEVKPGDKPLECDRDVLNPQRV